MYALFGSLRAHAGERDTLATLLLDAAALTGRYAGCLQYLVSIDPADADTVYVSELWRSAEDHAASLRDPAVLALIGRARPLIDGIGVRYATTPLGGHGMDGE